MIFDMECETMPREALEAIQLRRLKATAARVYANVPFYRQKFTESGVTPGDIRSMDDLRRLPSQIESVLMETSEVAPHYQRVVDRIDNLDTLTVKVEINAQMFSGEVKELQRIERLLSKNIKEYLGLSAIDKLVEPKAIARSEGKAVRVVDNRKF